MPVLARIDWICRQIDMKRKVHVTIGQAMDPSKLKIKVILDAPESGTISPCTCFGVKSVLGWIRELVQMSIAVDRGHRYSCGRSEVAIWIRIPSLPSHGSDYLPPPPAPPNDTDYYQAAASSPALGRTLASSALPDTKASEASVPSVDKANTINNDANQGRTTYLFFDWDSLDEQEREALPNTYDELEVALSGLEAEFLLLQEQKLELEKDRDRLQEQHASFVQRFLALVQLRETQPHLDITAQVDESYATFLGFQDRINQLKDRLSSIQSRLDAIDELRINLRVAVVTPHE